MSAPDHPKGLADLKELAAKLRRPLHTLHVLEGKSDPYMADQPSRTGRANWFVGLYNQLGIRFGVHVRHFFYKLISQRDHVTLCNGKPLENTVECFNQLGSAILDARYLDLIPGDAIIDRRNPPPFINRDDTPDASAELEIADGDVERHELGINYEAPTLSLPEAVLISEPRIGQRYHLEIWIEKSTANDVLLPLGVLYGINIATFVGEVSATACKNLVDRAIASGCPVRIFHITDFDPGGRSMPVAAAVKIGYYAKKSGVDLDIRFEHVALTEEQCIEYELPRKPIKETEVRAANFEARFGAGMTELDALEATHPGVLRQILVEHIARYYDGDLDEAVSDAVDRFKTELERATSEVSDVYADEIAALNEQRDAIARTFEQVNEPAHAAYREAVARAYEAYTAAIEPVRDEIEAMERQFVDEAEELTADMAAWLADAAPDPELFDWPEPAEADEDDDDPLYDSRRTYVEQVDRFRAYQGEDADVRLAQDRVVTKTCFDPKCGKVFETTARVGKQKYCSHLCAGRHTQQLCRDRRKRQAAEGQT
jgi:hypothetical protein